MAKKRNRAGKTWKEHVAPYLSKAMQQASRTWKPKGDRTNNAKVEKLRKKRSEINNQIRLEVEKG